MRAARQVSYATLAVGSLATLVTAIHALEPGRDSSAWLFLFGTAFWVLSPYGVFALVVHHFGDTATRSYTLLGLSIVFALFGAGAFIDGFFIEQDAQSGLVFLIIPFYQWVGCAIVAGIFAWKRSAQKV